MQTKQIQIILLILVLCLQGLHIASAVKTYDYAKYLDNLMNKSYTAFDSATLKDTYLLSYMLVVSGLSVLMYTALLLVKLVGVSLSAKVQELFAISVGVFQFSMAVVLAISQSRLIDPNGSHSSAFFKETNYVTMFNTQLADTIILWVICVPGSYILIHFTSESPAASPSPAKAQTEFGIRTE